MDENLDVKALFKEEGNSLFGLHNSLASNPFIRPFYSTLELEFDSKSIDNWIKANYMLAPCICVLYLAMCYLGVKFMEKREAFDLKAPLRYWNLLLAIFSFIGMFRILPHLIFLINKIGFGGTFVISPLYTYAHGYSGFWVLCFLFSKYAELFDTLFLILRKRKVNFLHWYHHATVLWYTWDACVSKMPAGIYFAAMNFSVHAFMYYYYYLMACSKTPRSWSKYVTIAQILQMFGGLFFNFCSLYFSYNLPTTTIVTAFKKTISLSKVNIFAAFLMYSTYLYLFLEYFVNRYFVSRKKVE